MSENSQHLLQETVFRLLGCNQNQNRVLNELISVKDSKENKSLLSDITELGYLPLLKTNPHDCVQKLVTLSSDARGKRLTGQKKEELHTVISVLKTLKSRKGFHLSSISKTLSVECLFHPEVWMGLHKQGVVPLQQFIKINQKNSDFVQLFIKTILEYGKNSDETPLISDVLSELITIGFTVHDKDTPRDSTKTSVAILEGFIKDVLNNALIDETKQADCVMASLCHLSVSISTQKLFYSHLFGLVMGYRPEMKVSKAIREQSKWVYGKINTELVMLFKQIIMVLDMPEIIMLMQQLFDQHEILMVLDMSEVITLIQQLFDQHEVNWQLFLSFISVLTVVIEDSQKHILEFTDSLLHEGLEDCNMETTITGMLITRQTCVQGQHVFMTYADWFQRTFSDSSRSFAASRKSFTFLMKLLTDLAPFESAEHLKVHILRPPFVPGKCRQILTDYIMLAKTRLQDLQEPLDVQTGADGADKSKTIDRFTEEIGNGVEAFQTTGKIPTSIIESSIFRKPYYIGQFLPALLKPRPLPDVPDGRMKLIAALKKADKIPPTMYQKYEKECKKEAMQLLEGVFEVLDSDDDMELSPMEQLDNSLQHLVTWVSNGHQGTDMPKHNLREFVSVISSRVEACLNETPVNPIDQSPIVINSCDLNLSGQHIQVVDMVLKQISEAMQTTYSSGSFEFVWLTKLLEALLPYSQFTVALCKRLFVLLNQQGCSLQNYHIDTLAAILVEIHMLKEQITLPVFQCSNCCTVGSSSVLELVTQHMAMETGEQMSLTLRFIGSCLKYVYSSHLDESRFSDTPCLMKRFIYLSKRLVPECRHSYMTSVEEEGCSDINDFMLLYQTEFIQKLVENYELDFQAWLDYELHIEVTADHLTEFERYEYHVWCIHQYYMNKTDEGYSNYTEAGSIMIKALLNRHNGCCKASKESHPPRVENVCKGAEFGLIQQLSNLTQLFKETESPSESLPWLLQQLMVNLEKLETDITKQNMVLTFTRLMLSLPSYLVFSNVPKNLTMKSHQLQGCIDCINSIFVTYLSEGVVFPVNLTIYMAQGLLQAIQSSQLDSVVEFVFERCPPLTLACVVHYQGTAPFVDMLIRDGRSEAQIFFFHLGNDFVLTTENHWLSACYVLSIVVTSTQRDTLQEIFGKDGFDDKQVLVILAEMMFIQMSYQQQFEQMRNDCRLKRFHSAINIILSEKGELGVLDSVLQGNIDSKTKQCINSHILKLYPVTILSPRYCVHILSHRKKVVFRLCYTRRFWFLRDFELDSVGHYSSTPGFNGLLRSYVTMCGLFEEDHTIKATKVVVTEDISKTCKFLVSVIEKTPTKILKSLDLELLMACGPLIYDAVLHQI